MKKLILLFSVLLSLFILSCSQKGAPSEQGELMTNEQIKNLPSSDSLNMKFVSFDGYFGFCNSVNMLKANTKNLITITSEADCEGDMLIKANIRIKSNESKEIFSKSRNYISAPKKFKTSDLKIITDDYQEVDYQKLRFSGNLVYKNGGYYLDNVTIHLIK